MIRDRQPPRRHREIADATAQRPQDPGRAVDEAGERADDSDRELFSVRGFGHELDEFQPLDAIIIAMGKEIAGYQIIEAASEAPRGKHDGKEDNTAKHHRELKHQPPLPTKPAQQHADDRDSKKEATARPQRRSMQHDLAGNMDVDPPFAVAGHGKSEQRGHECRDNRSTERETGIDSPTSNKGI